MSGISADLFLRNLEFHSRSDILRAVVVFHNIIGCDTGISGCNLSQGVALFHCIYRRRGIA